jgi:hypothetical protein
MSHLPITPAERFATLVEECLDKPEVTLPLLHHSHVSRDLGACRAS